MRLTTSVFGPFGGPVPKGDAMADRHAVRLEDPYTYRPIATVIGQIGRVAGIILCPTILYENMIAVMFSIGAFYGNPRITIVPGRCAENSYIGRLINIYPRLLKAIYKQVAGRNMATGV